jgi:hypothetical protein
MVQRRAARRVVLVGFCKYGGNGMATFWWIILWKTSESGSFCPYSRLPLVVSTSFIDSALKNEIWKIPPQNDPPEGSHTITTIFTKTY